MYLLRILGEFLNPHARIHRVEVKDAACGRQDVHAQANFQQHQKKKTEDKLVRNLIISVCLVSIGFFEFSSGATPEVVAWLDEKLSRAVVEDWFYVCSLPEIPSVSSLPLRYILAIGAWLSDCV